ncbi:MAG: MFS transporter, partial [Chloroflexota bacterium]|nr:MFS transporter [Chloroflexota bacterium]
VVGAILFSVVAGRLSRRGTFIACFLAVGLAILAISSAPPFPVAVATMFVMGLAGGPLNPILMSIRQERVPLPYRARVFGTTTAISFVAIPLGQLTGGFVIEWMGVQTILAAVAGIYITVVLSFFFNPVLREMDQPAVTM